jgi:hypothetical protein
MSARSTVVQGERVGVTERDACFRIGAGASDPESPYVSASLKAAESVANRRKRKPTVDHRAEAKHYQAGEAAPGTALDERIHRCDS